MPTLTQTALLADLYAFLAQHAVPLEDLLDALAAAFSDQAARETDPLLRTLYDGVAVHLADAALDFYVSTK